MCLPVNLVISQLGVRVDSVALLTALQELDLGGSR